MSKVTKQFHQNTYSAIDPSSPENSAQGRNVLITGAAEGIGFATAVAFLQANAAHVILVTRRAAQLDDIVANLTRSRPKSSTTVIVPIACDISTEPGVEALWTQLKDKSISVDVMVLNAAMIGPSPATSPANVLWKVFEVNVLSNLRMTESFLGQGEPSGKSLLYISTSAAHSNPAPFLAAYGSSKAAFSKYLQHLAEETDADRVQIINFHPGNVLTENAARNGYTADMQEYDTVDLPASFAVWAASKQASFLHGRFVWANWDVLEMSTWKTRLEDDVGFLKIGLQGIPSVDLVAETKKVTAARREQA